MVIIDVQPAHVQASLPFIKVNLNGIVVNFNHPEHVVGINVHVVVVNLLRQGGRSDRTGIQVKSNKGERTPMLAPVDSDELALDEPHVRLVRQRHCGSGAGTGPASSDVRQTHEPVEVGDLRWVTNVGQCHSWIKRIMVDGDSEGLEWHDASGNWLEQRASAPPAIVIPVVSISRVWAQKAASQSCPSHTTS